MALQNHLIRRQTRYYWRGRVPLGLLKPPGRSHICLSLGTSSAVLARSRARRVSVAIGEVYARLRIHMALAGNGTLARVDFDRIVRRVFLDVLDQGEARRAAEVPSDDPQYGWVQIDVGDDNPDDADAVWRKESHILADQEVFEWSERLARNELDSIAPLVQSILQNEGLLADPHSADYRNLLRQALRARLKAAEVDRDREHGIYKEDDALFDVLSRPAEQPRVVTVAEPKPAPAPEPVPTQPVSAYVEEWIAEKRRTIKWTNQTEKQNRNSLKLLIKIAGDKSLHLYTRKDIEQLHRKLEKIPSNYKKSSKHESMPVDDVIAEAQAKQTPPLSRSTLDRHWFSITGFCAWVRTQTPPDAPKADLAMLFDRLAWSASVPGSEIRLAWTDETLQKLFQSPIWTGYEPSPRKRYWRHEPGETITRDEFWWLPLLAILHGGRLEEYCCLTGQDVCDIDGVPIMDICKGLKTPRSARVVPVHSLAIACGFLDFAKDVGENRLFPAMQKAGPDSKYGHIYSENFTDYRKRIGLYTALMDFHSMRKTVTSRMVQAGVAENLALLLADEITGHDSKHRQEVSAFKTITLDYLAKSELSRLREAIESVRYPSVTFDHMVVPVYSTTTGNERGEEIRRRKASGRV